MFVIKWHGAYLCGFTFREGYDYRRPGEISYFAHILMFPAITELVQMIADKNEGKIRKVSW